MASIGSFQLILRGGLDGVLEGHLERAEAVLVDEAALLGCLRSRAPRAPRHLDERAARACFTRTVPHARRRLDETLGFPRRPLGKRR